MIEIEILVELYTDIEIAKLSLAHCCKQGCKVINDTYYFDPLRGNLQPNENHKIFECCRIREAADKVILTYKKDHYNNDLWSHSDEFETFCDDGIQLKLILNKLGLQELIAIHNKRTIYTFEEYEIVLEEVQGLGNFIEVEYKFFNDEITDIDSIKSKLRDFITSLGLSIGEELNSGKPELMLIKKFANQ